MAIIASGFPHAEQPASTAFLIPRDGHFLWRIRSALRLHRLLASQPFGRWPREQRLTRFQFHRASLMLRAWDGVESGASLKLRKRHSGRPHFALQDGDAFSENSRSARVLFGVDDTMVPLVYPARDSTVTP